METALTPLNVVNLAVSICQLGNQRLSARSFLRALFQIPCLREVRVGARSCPELGDFSEEIRADVGAWFKELVLLEGLLLRLFPLRSHFPTLIINY